MTQGWGSIEKRAASWAKCGITADGVDMSVIPHEKFLPEASTLSDPEQLEFLNRAPPPVDAVVRNAGESDIDFVTRDRNHWKEAYHAECARRSRARELGVYQLPNDDTIDDVDGRKRKATKWGIIGIGEWLDEVAKGDAELEAVKVAKKVKLDSEAPATELLVALNFANADVALTKAHMVAFFKINKQDFKNTSTMKRAACVACIMVWIDNRPLSVTMPLLCAAAEPPAPTVV